MLHVTTFQQIDRWGLKASFQYVPAIQPEFLYFRLDPVAAMSFLSHWVGFSDFLRRLYLTHSPQKHPAWNKGKLNGQKPPLKLKEVGAIRTRLQMAHRARDFAMFNLAIDSTLRSCDLVKRQVRDIAYGTQILKPALILQQNEMMVGCSPACALRQPWMTR